VGLEGLRGRRDELLRDLALPPLEALARLAAGDVLARLGLASHDRHHRMPPATRSASSAIPSADARCCILLLHRDQKGRYPTRETGL
jgi:hypothetical protein